MQAARPQPTKISGLAIELVARILALTTLMGGMATGCKDFRSVAIKPDAGAAADSSRASDVTGDPLLDSSPATPGSGGDGSDGSNDILGSTVGAVAAVREMAQ
jgi:hypothetical protein